MNYYIDTHCHLTDKKLYHNLDQIIFESNSAGVKYILSISDNIDIFEKNRQISEKYENIFWSIGIHPHYANENYNDLKDIFNQFLNDTNIIGFGEIGLDYYYGADTRTNQISLLEKQLLIASSTNLPLIIHARNADNDIFDILKNNTITNKIIMHCYTGDIDFAKKLLSKFDVYFSFNGIITFKKSNAVRNVLEFLPIEKIILETDAPYLTPEPFRGKVNKPYYMEFIYNEASKIKKKSLDIFKSIIYNNCLKIFNSLNH